MGKTDQFFKEKQPWSKVKDAVLGTYLEPYLTKVSTFGAPIRIADCFAGKGRFDDGDPGSPLIICDAVQRQLDRVGHAASDIKVILIEKKYPKELKKNLPPKDWVHLLEGDYESCMETFIAKYDAKGRHLFLYADPFGIKSLRFSYFENIQQQGFKTVELLLNLNAFGFLREGCRLLNLEKHEPEEPLEYEPDVNSPEHLDEIAGGSYWRGIVSDYYAGTQTMRDAEEAFVKLYCEKLRTVFEYVVNTPIKAKLNHIPKYRIIFGTKHADGLLLMVDSMSKRWEEFRDQARAGQSYLFEMDIPEPSILSEYLDYEKAIPAMISNEIELKVLLVQLIQRYGISFSTRQYKDYLKRLEENHTIEVRREPERSPSGKTRSGWAHDDKAYTVYISRKKEWQQNLL